MNGKLFPLFHGNRRNYANAQHHRTTMSLHHTCVPPYILRRRRSMRPYPHSARRNRLPSRCGRDHSCRCGCGFCLHWTSNRSSRDPARPLPDRRCNRSGCRYRRRSSPFPYRWGLSRCAAPGRGCPDRWAAPDRWCNRSDRRSHRPSSPARRRWAFCYCGGSTNGRHTLSDSWGSYSRSPRAGRRRAPASRPRCRWDPWPRQAPCRGYPGLYRRFQRYPSHDGRTRNRTCNIQPRIRRWLRT